MGAYLFFKFSRKKPFWNFMDPWMTSSPSSTRGGSLFKVGACPPPFIRLSGGNYPPPLVARQWSCINIKQRSLFDEFGACYTHNTSLVVNLENICLQKSPPEFSVILFSLLKKLHFMLHWVFTDFFQHEIFCLTNSVSITFLLF